MSLQFNPPYTPPAQADAQLRERGYAVLAPASLAADVGRGLPELLALQSHWDDLPPDDHLRDGGRYRRRRHGSWLLQAGQATAMPHRAHWQPVEYNALHGGFERWFAPITPALASHPAWLALLLGLGRHANALRGEQAWHVEAHTFRIDTQGGIGRPTPEGAHRDGVDLVAVVLMRRQGVKGGETRVFEANGPQGLRFTMAEPLTTLLLDDARVIHETTPIQPMQAEQAGLRDTLVLTYRAGGFQEAG